jgi:hypothetical protein
MGLFACAPAAAQSAGYVYLVCDFQAASPGQQPESIQLKIGRTNWHVFDASKQTWGPSLCRTDFSTGYRGECSFSETRFELVATTGPVKQTTTINRRDGSILRRAAGASDAAGTCRAVSAPPGKP